MKINNLTVKYTTLVILCLTLISCEKDEFDGLLNIDPVPEAAITFPQSAGPNGQPLLDEGAFIIYQDAIANGSVSIEIRVPEGKQITSVAATAQRFRNGAATTPNISPTFTTATTPAGLAARAPDAVITRNTAPNLPSQAVGPASTVTFTIPTNPLPAPLMDAELSDLQVNDVIRFFFRVTLADGTEHRAMEVRVVVTG
ncbi:hypothetical protein [Pontibacter sp. HSC-36F09]|uniref:hypothetical protein n=1 Tax=Pontibacter sp. HSC-36F09 TaxID=2910966 RepID=UPI0020A10CF6|nr:hypothetical protein [Pontibacter sp. HSC-36F09]MCP2042209.1 hypothetical protein [Pontibacter sp. HSC-36F09]